MSQSAVSHAVTALETLLRVELLRRDARSTRLTEVGERMLHHAREVLRLKAQMHEEAESARRLHTGVVRIGSYGPTSSRHLLPPILQQFARRYPKLKVRVLEGSDDEVESWLHEQRIDVGFVNLPHETFDTLQLARDELVVVLHESSALANYSRIRPEKLQGLPFIMSTGGCEPAIRAMVRGNWMFNTGSAKCKRLSNWSTATRAFQSNPHYRYQTRYRPESFVDHSSPPMFARSDLP